MIKGEEGEVEQYISIKIKKEKSNRGATMINMRKNGEVR